MRHPDRTKLVARGTGELGSPRTIAREFAEPGGFGNPSRVPDEKVGLTKSLSAGTSPGPWGHMLTQMSGFIAELRDNETPS
jgi:hypothetical protein